MNSSAFIRDACTQCSLSEFAVFKDCSPELLESVFSNKRLMAFGKMDTLLLQGESFKGVYCIQQGVLKVLKQGSDGKEFLLWFAKPGDIIGADSCINNEDYSFTVVAAEPVCACYIPAADFRKLIDQKPSIIIRLMKDLCGKLSFIEGRLTNISRKKIRENFAEVLISLAVKGKNTAEGDIPITYSIRDIANILGTTNTYLYKILNDFSRRNLISRKNKKLVIKDFNRLSLVAIGDEAGPE